MVTYLALLPAYGADLVVNGTTVTLSGCSVPLRS
jgi:hypothetical protein